MPQKRLRDGFQIEELGGAEFSSLAEAQRAALPILAGDFAASLHRLMARGDLIIESGCLIASRSKKR